MNNKTEKGILAFLSDNQNKVSENTGKTLLDIIPIGCTVDKLTSIKIVNETVEKIVSLVMPTTDTSDTVGERVTLDTD
jgi:hypothetical protein